LRWTCHSDTAENKPHSGGMFNVQRHYITSQQVYISRYAFRSD